MPGIRRTMKAALARGVTAIGRKIVPPFMRWLADGELDLVAAPVSAPQSYVSAEGCPLTVWLLTAAMVRATEGPDAQRDLNGCLELMRLDSVHRPLMLMFASLQASGYPMEEVFFRTAANVLLIGFTAGRMYAGFDRGPDVDAEFEAGGPAKGEGA